jgi:hypothetical protein
VPDNQSATRDGTKHENDLSTRAKSVQFVQLLFSVRDDDCEAGLPV